MNVIIPHNLSSSEVLVRTILKAPNRERALIEALGKPGSKKRKRLPKSLRRKVHTEVNPNYIPKSRKRELPLTQTDIRFRESLRQIDYRNSFHSLENERRALSLLDDTIHRRRADVQEEYALLKQTFDHFGVDLQEVLREKYEGLSFYNSDKEAGEKVLYGKLMLFGNKAFKVNSFCPCCTDHNKVARILEPLNEYEKKVFVETILFDPDVDDEEEVEAFIKALVAVSEAYVDERFTRETLNAISSAGNSLLQQVIALARSRIESTQDYEQAGLKHFASGITTRGVSPDSEYVEGKEDEVDEEYQEFYESVRQDILLTAIENGMLTPNQIEFEKIYEAAIYEGIRFRALRAMVKSIGVTLKLSDVERFFLDQTENVLVEPDSDIWRRMNIIEAYARLLPINNPSGLLRFLDHEDIYLTIAAYRMLVYKELFNDKGINLLASRIRKDILKGDYKLLGIATLGCASGHDDVQFPSIELVSKVFASSDLDLSLVYKEMDGLNLPFNEDSHISYQDYAKSTYDFISSIGLKELSRWITHPVNLSQRTNAIKVFQMFPLGEREIFMTKIEGKRLLRKLGIPSEIA